MSNEDNYFVDPDGQIWESKADYDANVGSLNPELGSSPKNEDSVPQDTTNLGDEPFFSAPDGMLYNDRDMYVICTFFKMLPDEEDKNVIWTKGEYLITPDGKIFTNAIVAEAHMAQVYPGVKCLMKEITIDEIKGLQAHYANVDSSPEPFKEFAQKNLKELTDALQEQPPIK